MTNLIKLEEGLKVTKDTNTHKQQIQRRLAFGVKLARGYRTNKPLTPRDWLFDLIKQEHPSKDLELIQDYWNRLAELDARYDTIAIQYELIIKDILRELRL